MWQARQKKGHAWLGWNVQEKEKGIGEVIHRYKNNGYNIVLDVNSGSVHVVDDIVYDLTGAVEIGRAHV